MVDMMVKQRAGHRGNSTRSILIGLAISLTGFVYGIDTGIIASTIAQTTFKLYMYGPSMDNISVRAGIVSGYYAGYAFESGGSAYCMDKLSRRWTLLFGACVGVAGAVLQTAAVNPAMMIIGRAFLLGVLDGHGLSDGPRISCRAQPPGESRISCWPERMMKTLGFFVAGWVGYAGSFAVGELQWRIPLATQIPPSLCLAIMTFFLPYSPRCLAMKERYDDAKKVMYSLHAHRGAETIEQEFAEMVSQIQLEANKKKVSNFWNLFTRQYIRRTLLACLTVNMMKLSGSNIIQNYQSVMYNSLEYEGQTVLLKAAVTAIWLSYAASLAFDAIEWKFYFVFIACNAFAGTIYFFFLPETRFWSLEEVAAKVGDEIVSPLRKDPELDQLEQDAADNKRPLQTSSNHIEDSRR
ncbi:hypothetical protein BDP81DRAFT_445736 [Colletotrichum phormii]|uniref:Major facilitator superfamily (MFS) profile domain-containing protein n=1 Tax=Colletotrichum phormii TaxID=359342 RepID=A0AAJ0A246_9PEZI|nr:uncharacterized protein BDP81DRAFT_445736 [Colletotrichum phormii]KAK1655070.1 hypothetical protein BDP81DRAFT_445736 [Colletotrichum phormii]